ncbi:MAG: hypothetical protein ACPG7F_16140, partial [Aggregatilineales bacterium]
VPGISTVMAQDDARCDGLFANVLTGVVESCNAPGEDSLCVGSSPANISLRGREVAFMPRDVLRLAEIERVKTGAPDVSSGNWGMTLLQNGMLLPDGQQLTMLLFGDAELQNLVELPTMALNTIPVNNIAGYDINLREGPGTAFNTAGVFLQDARLLADGRSEDNAWLRVRLGDGTVAWVTTGLLEIEGDAAMLTMLEGTYTAPMQAVQLFSSPESGGFCGVTASGLLLDLAATADVRLLINEVQLTFRQATLVIQANATQGLRIAVIGGDVAVTAGAFTVTAGTGQLVTVPLAPDTLLAADRPQLQVEYDFVSIGGAPLQLLRQNRPGCITGAGVNQTVVFYNLPEEVAISEDTLDSTQHYAVTGRTTDAENITWLRLENGRWVNQADVRSAGLCSQVPLLELDGSVPVPTATVAPSDSDGTEEASIATGAFIPGISTTYQTESGNDTPEGSCTQFPLPSRSYPVTITGVDDDTLIWDGQGEEYLLQSDDGVTFIYEGRNQADDSTLTLTLRFDDSAGWSMDWVEIQDDDPGCTHQFVYRAGQRSN